MRPTSRLALVAALFSLLAVTPLEGAVPGSLFKLGANALKVGGVVVGAGAAAAGAAAAAEKGVETYDISQLLDVLKAQHADATERAIYSVTYSLNGEASSVMWADIFSKPDTFVVIEIEGVGHYLLPNIHQNYGGETVLQTVLAGSVPPGRRVAVYLLDDDSTSDAIWNSILSSRVQYTVEASHRVSRAEKIQVTASGSIQLLQRPATLDAADMIACAVFPVPEAPDHQWRASAQLLDGKGQPVGKLEFAQLGEVPWEKYEAALAQRRHAIFYVALFGVLGVCGAMVFRRSLGSGSRP